MGIMREKISLDQSTSAASADLNLNPRGLHCFKTAQRPRFFLSVPLPTNFARLAQLLRRGKC